MPQAGPGGVGPRGVLARGSGGAMQKAVFLLVLYVGIFRASAFVDSVYDSLKCAVCEVCSSL